MSRSAQKWYMWNQQSSAWSNQLCKSKWCTVNVVHLSLYEWQMWKNTFINRYVFGDGRNQGSVRSVPHPAKSWLKYYHIHFWIENYPHFAHCYFIGWWLPFSIIIARQRSKIQPNLAHPITRYTVTRTHRNTLVITMIADILRQNRRQTISTHHPPR